MQTSLKKWGNSAAVRIPAAIVDAASLKIDDLVEVREEAGRIVIEPVRVSKPRLADLLKRMTPENLHGEADFGPPRGREVW